MSILTDARGTGQRKQSGPMHYSALRDPIAGRDPIADGVRTYQLIARDSDQVPHALSAAGAHPDILDALNQRRALTYERDVTLKDDKSADADARRAEIKTALDALVKFSLERTDFAASMLMLYADAEAAADADAEAAEDEQLVAAA